LPPERATGIRRVEHIMGMPIVLDVRDEGVDPAVLDAVFDSLRDADAVFSTYRPDSDISRLNAGELLLRDCRPEVDEVLGRCAELRERTGGYFSVRATGRLDPSGYVKGWAVGRAAGALDAAAVRSFCLNAGGDLVLRGRPAPGERWRIGIQHPGQRDALAAVLGGEDIAVATSGQYERGEHVIDPLTGAPPRGLLSVTIVGPDLATADAYATAVLAMGSAGPAFAAELPGYEALCISDRDTVLTTPGLARYRIS
jgi:FAD:protein FMN transferase